MAEMELEKNDAVKCPYCFKIVSKGSCYCGYLGVYENNVNYAGDRKPAIMKGGGGNER